MVVTKREKKYGDNDNKYYHSTVLESQLSDDYALNPYFFLKIYKLSNAR